MSEKMRATMHNGRTGEKGVFTSKHNDRNFNTKNTKHINGEKSVKNWTWHLYQKKEPNITFDDAERRFYETYFGKSLEAQNDRHRAKRNYKRVRTIDDYRKAIQTCPEETLYQIGKKDNTVLPAVIYKIALEQINWEIKTFPNVKILDAALHVDERGAPHMHKRQVWVANGKDGLTVSQNKALKEMGIERPDMSKKEDRHNNAKMSYTEQCRNHFLELCKQHGLEIEIEPKDASETGLSLLEYQRRQEEKKLEDAKQAQKDISCKINNAVTSFKAQINDFQSRMDKLSRDEEKVKIKLSDASRKMKIADNYLAKKTQEGNTYLLNRKKEADSYVSERIKEIDARNAYLDERQAELDVREKSMRNSQRRAIEDIKGMAAYVKSMSEEQLKRTRAIMEQVENAENFEDCVNALPGSSTGIYR